MTIHTKTAMNILRRCVTAADKDTANGYDSYREELFEARFNGAIIALRAINSPDVDATRDSLTAMRREMVGAKGWLEWAVRAVAVFDEKGPPRTPIMKDGKFTGLYQTYKLSDKE